MSSVENQSVTSPAAKKRKITDEVNTRHSTNSNNSQSMVSNGSSNGSGSAAANNSSSSPQTEIDESLYSRQLYVYGEQAMRRMANSDILISGMSGLGVEVAKDIILAGVKSVILHDSANTTMSDLSSQFYLKESDVGSNRAEACVGQLQDLNSYVKVSSYTGELTDDYITRFSVIVLTASSLEEQLHISQLAHQNNQIFIVAETRGVFGQIFTDFGENFQVIDTNGEQPVTCMIASITKDAEGGVVTCLDETRHGLEDGDHVTFVDVEGMTEINNCTPRKIKVLGPYTFSVGDTSGMTEYTKGGEVKQVKVPKTTNFKPMTECLQNPEVVVSDFAKFDRPAQLHLAFQAFHKYHSKHGRPPGPWNQSDCEEFLKEVGEVNNAITGSAHVEELDAKLLSLFSYMSSGHLAPMDAVIGSITAQEVIKGISGKFSPIFQNFYFDALEIVPAEPNVAEMEKLCAPTGSRYDGQVAVLGSDFQQKMLKQKYFLVGAGAIGCEHLKNMAMMGLGAGSGGEITVTDMDHIEKSNLNRQFLFRPKDIQQPKSSTAAAAAKAMNPDMNIKPLEDRVGNETESIFTDEFFMNLDGVANALDNVDSRIYIDRRCVYYRKPLLESGTLGTKGNTQVVLPFKTESYSSSQDPPEKSIPICTLKNFPNAIEHTLHWARDRFEGAFNEGALNASQYLSDPTFVEKAMKQPGNQPVEVLESVKKCLVTDKPSTFEECIAWARLDFQEQYHNQIVQLLHNFPPDQTTTSGALFWSLPKRCPKPVIFDIDDKLHMDYIVSAANLRAFMYGIPQSADVDMIRRAVASVNVPVFSAQSGVRIATTDAEAHAQMDANADVEYLETLRASIPSAEELSGTNINPLDFEKDDDSNYHMDFITACSNLRASNYAIPHATRSQSKLIAGKIIPAIATTTSLVSGLVCLELMKLVQGYTDIELYKNGFVNLALPFFGFSEPMPAPVQKYYDTEWTLWDRFEVEGEMTLQEFINYFKDEHKLDIAMLSQGVAMIYSFFMAASKRNERLAMPMSRVVELVGKKEIPPYVQALVLELCCNDAEGEDVDVPYVKYNLKK